ncbi:MAG: AgmX/PglI C-terminal domain-containing protein [Polyangiaceae bacterium]|nr:AgmX/PglI C-terminal domain-containing protein [Polyangiaceae bacterium]
MAGLLSNAYAMTPPSSPWAGDGPTQAADLNGPAWGAAWERGEGAGGLSLSGVGEGAGGQGAGIGVGTMGIGLGSLGSGLTSVGRPRESGEGFSVGRAGRLGGSHRSTIRFCHGGCDRTHVSGRLPPETVQRIVRQSFGRFRACYADELVKNPTLVARVEMRFVIDRSGFVASARGSGNGPERLTQCVTRAFYSLAFPQPEGGAVNVTYPIAFSPE